MSSYAPSKKRKLSRKEQKEPNLIPIMNLFLVLIPMLMTMMVSVHLAMIGVNYSAGGSGQEEASKDKKDTPDLLTLKILNNQFEITVGEKEAIKIAVRDSLAKVKVFNFIELDNKLNELKKDNEDQSTIVVMTDADVLYDTLLRSIDICKANGFPNVKYITVGKLLLRRSS